MAITIDHEIPRDEHVWAFGPSMDPVLTVDPGAVIRMELNDCFHGQVTSEADLFTSLDLKRVNSATGPVYVRGAEPGDSLVVELLEVLPAARGSAMIIPGFGQLSHLVDGPVTRIFRVEDGVVHMNERISFPIRPMVGVIGVATGGEECINFLAGQHGGNLDNHLHGPGSTVYLPVRQPGGMFAVGDMHAAMGDGEISGTGVEIAGTVVVRLGLLKGAQGRWPVTELRDSWVAHGTSGGDLTEALAYASEEAARLLVDGWGFSIEDAFIFLSVACDAGIAQACQPSPASSIARVVIPKIAACPRPFPPTR
jgi:amidase